MEGRRSPDPRPAATRRRVLDATLALLAEVGFEGASIEAISERSGVSRSTIYRHWPDPSDLYIGAFDAPPGQESDPNISGNFRADVLAFAQHVARRLNNDQFAAALAAQVDKARRDPAYRKAHLRYVMTRNETGMAIFRNGIESGQVRAGTDPEMETDRILSMLVYQRLMKNRRITRALVRETVIETIGRCAAD